MTHKPCGCIRGGLTRARAVWTCAACNETQNARRKACQRCKRVKSPNPRGFGCCGVGWARDATHCGDILHAYSALPVGFDPCGRGFDSADLSPLPHPEVDYLTIEECRDAFLDRAGVVRCAGCLAPE